MTKIKNFDEIPIVLTYQDCADVLGVHPRTIKRWISNGSFIQAAVREGNTVLFRRDQFLEWLEGKTENE